MKIGLSQLQHKNLGDENNDRTKKQMLVSAEKNLKNYEKLLETLKRSNLEDKAIRIKECEHAIQKQKQIISNIKSYMNDTPDTVIMNEGGIK